MSFVSVAVAGDLLTWTEKKSRLKSLKNAIIILSTVTMYLGIDYRGLYVLHVL